MHVNIRIALYRAGYKVAHRQNIDDKLADAQ